MQEDFLTLKKKVRVSNGNVQTVEEGKGGFVEANVNKANEKVGKENIF